MPSWFHRALGDSSQQPQGLQPPLPEWSASKSQSYADGLYDDAPDDEYKAAEKFCATHPLEPPRLIASHQIQSIQERSQACWGLDVPRLSRFRGNIQNISGVADVSASTGMSGLSIVQTVKESGDTCIFSNIPLMCGLYHPTQGLRGFYYEVKVHLMDGVIAVGKVIS